MPKNLLLADDSITIQKVVGITFAGEDFSIVAVDNGDDAVRKAKELHPDIVLADVVMPKKNGYEVCEAIKNDPALSAVPVLLLAGTFEAFDEVRARNARADGHIAKPFESQALINKVRELLDRGAGSAEQRGSASAGVAPTQSATPSPAISSETLPSVPFSIDLSSEPSLPAPSTVPPAPSRAAPGSVERVSGTPAPNPPVGPAPSVGGRSPGGSPATVPLATLPPTARSIPPVLSRPAPPGTAPTPPKVERRPDVRPTSPAGLTTGRRISEESFEDPWKRDEAAVTAPPASAAAAPAERGAVGELDWAALGVETDAAAGTTPPRPSSPVGATRQTVPPASTAADAAPVGFAREVVPGVPARTPMPAAPSFPRSPPTSTTAKQTGSGSGMSPAVLPDVPPARFASPKPGQVGSSGSGNPIRPIVLDRQATTSSSQARSVDPAASHTASATKAVLDLGEPIDLTDLEIEEPGSAQEVRVNPAPLAAIMRPDDGGEALLRDALSRTSREVIERIAWEIIPTLAETIIREHVERLVKQREK